MTAGFINCSPRRRVLTTEPGVLWQLWEGEARKATVIRLTAPIRVSASRAARLSRLLCIRRCLSAGCTPMILWWMSVLRVDRAILAMCIPAKSRSAMQLQFQKILLPGNCLRNLPRASGFPTCCRWASGALWIRIMYRRYPSAVLLTV